MGTYREYQQDQGMLFPPRVGELIPEDDEVRAFSEIIDRLDIAPLTANYKVSGVSSGAPAHHARMMLKLLFWGYSHGFRSSRRLADFARFDVRGMWLCGEQTPRHTAIWDFRVRHGLETIEDIFVQILRVGADLGLRACGAWAIDGTRIRANAAKGAVASREQLEKELARLRDEIAAALREAEASDTADDRPDEDDEHRLPPDLRRKADRAQRIEDALRRMAEAGSDTGNATDPDAPTMQRTGDGAAPAYNAQATVDTGTQLIIAADVTTEHTDYGELLPQVDQALANTGETPSSVLADTGYASGPNFAGLADRGLLGFVPQRREEETHAGLFTRSWFDYDADADQFVCPDGRPLIYDRSERRYASGGDYSRRVYRSTGCGGCPLASACKKPSVKRRTLRVSEHEELQQQMRERLATEDGSKAYVKRKTSVEPTFGTIKSALGFRRFMRRGLTAIRSEWKLMCAAFNLLKLTRQIRKALQG